jgi:hypothetical protein
VSVFLSYQRYQVTQLNQLKNGKTLSKELEQVKGRLSQLNRVIDYTVKDESDVEDLREWLDRKRKERDAEEQQREDKAKAEIAEKLRREKKE